ncbi:MAG: pantetheine-phosphate adenylyltransferase, partial [Chlamydiota bacterium]|nr:pantetheine-phosphate adenylyltransferase [Chlamydiota bacterium]
MNRAVYPGTFDPITFGHMDIINRATKIYDSIIIAIAEKTIKNTLFSLDERVDMLKKSLKELASSNPKVDRIQITIFSGLLVDFCSREGYKVVIRGLRAISDFEYEFQMALTNKKLNESVETLFMM